MTKNEQSLKQTMQLIVDILSFAETNDVLEHRLKSTNVNWDLIVQVASSHLVLPAVYCRLQQKSLLYCLPDDLVLFLEELTQLNRERNQQLLLEAQHVSKFFESHQINHVFLKGIALLAGQYFKDIGERMISDIDILIASDDLKVAYDLLVKEGYSKSLPFNYELQNYRHLPRQISENHLGAIELHNQLLRHGFNHLIDKEPLLSNRQTLELIPIPSAEYLIWNTILAHEINDHGYYYNILKLRSLYDVLAVGLPEHEHIIDELSKQRYGSHFLNLSVNFDSKLKPKDQTFANRLQKFMYLMTLKYPKFGKFSRSLKLIYKSVEERIALIFFNRSYRKHILKNKFKN